MVDNTNEYIFSRIKKMRNIRRGTLAFAVIAVFTLVSIVVVSFVVAQLTVQKEYRDAREKLKTAVFSLQDQVTFTAGIIDNASAEDKESDEYLETNESSTKSEELLRIANEQLSQSEESGFFLASTSFEVFDHLASQADDYNNLLKNFTETLSNKLDSANFDRMIYDLRAKINDASALMTKAKGVVSSGDIKSLQDEVKSASDLIEVDLGDDDKVKAYSSMKDRVNETLAALTQKMSDLEEKYNKKKK